MFRLYLCGSKVVFENILKQKSDDHLELCNATSLEHNQRLWCKNSVYNKYLIIKYVLYLNSFSLDLCRLILNILCVMNH